MVAASDQGTGPLCVGSVRGPRAVVGGSPDTLTAAEWFRRAAEIHTPAARAPRSLADVGSYTAAAT